MSSENRIPGSAADWLERAAADLALARVPLPRGARREDLCFHAQQAAEKALKAVYQRQRWAFRYTHDLDELITGLKAKGLDVPESIEETDILSRYAWETRYPGVEEPVTESEYLEAIQLAESVLAWARQIIETNSDHA